MNVLETEYRIYRGAKRLRAGLTFISMVSLMAAVFALIDVIRGDVLPGLLGVMLFYLLFEGFAKWGMWIDRHMINHPEIE